MASKIREKASQLAWLLREGRIPQAVGFLSQLLIGRSLYTEHLATYFETEQLPVCIEGNVIYLSPTDPGISTELLHFGTHEPAATEVMRREFARVRNRSDHPTVIEIGANRGYYAFLAADVFDGDGTVYAIEPEPKNFEALLHGIDANEFENVRAERCAIGAENTTKQLNLARRSNSHTLRSVPDDDGEKYSGETVETGVYRLDSYLEEVGLSPAAVDVVRMDVEGYEAAVFEGINALLEADSGLLLFVELHPHRVPPEKLTSLVTRIETAGFELIHASSSVRSEFPAYDAVRRHLTIPKGRHTVELVARRTAASIPETNVTETHRSQTPPRRSSDSE